jgi:adenylate cyclase
MPRPFIAFVIAVLATLLAFVGRDTLLPVDNQLYDSGLNARPWRQPDDIIILGIDEKFMEQRHAYLAPRDRLATLIRNLAAGKPRAIALDVWLDSYIESPPTPKGVDAQLRAALRYAKSQGVPVVLSDVPVSAVDAETDSRSALTTGGAVLPYFGKEARSGSVLFRPDEDGVVRQHMREIPGQPSLPLQMARLGGSKNRDLKRLESEGVPLTFTGPPGTIQSQSAVDYLQPYSGLLLAGKLVFIGANFERSKDFQKVPGSHMPQAKPMYGVELLAQATQSLRREKLQGSHETPQARNTDLLLAFVAALIVALLALGGTARGVLSALIFMIAACLSAVLSARYASALWGFRFHPASPFLLALPLSAGGGIAWRSIIEGRELRRVRDTFGAYVGSAVLESLGGKMPELGGETRPIAVLFCDIRGYSALAESMSNDPKALLDELNAHFAPLVAALQKRGAYVDNYVGDLVMALFGTPVSSGSYQTDVRAAVLAALDFVSIVEARNIGRRAKGQFPIEVGIGVHCGEAVVGNMGTTDAQAGGKIHYTAIGDVVNVASRIESATRGQNVALLVTREVVEACGQGEELPPWERIGEVNVKGRAAAVEIFKVGQ